MPAQPQPLPAPPDPGPPADDFDASLAAPPPQAELSYPATLPTPPVAPPAPVWFQRVSLFILVIFCVYLGAIMTVLPWWHSLWDFNGIWVAHPRIWAVMRLGPVRGIISGLGLLDIWIGISEAIHYRDER